MNKYIIKEMRVASPFPQNWPMSGGELQESGRSFYDTSNKPLLPGDKTYSMTQLQRSWQPSAGDCCGKTCVRSDGAAGGFQIKQDAFYGNFALGSRIGSPHLVGNKDSLGDYKAPTKAQESSDQPIPKMAKDNAQKLQFLNDFSSRSGTAVGTSAVKKLDYSRSASQEGNCPRDTSHRRQGSSYKLSEDAKAVHDSCRLFKCNKSPFLETARTLAIVNARSASTSKLAECNEAQAAVERKNRSDKVLPKEVTPSTFLVERHLWVIVEQFIAQRCNSHAERINLPCVQHLEQRENDPETNSKGAGISSAISVSSFPRPPHLVCTKGRSQTDALSTSDETQYLHEGKSGSKSTNAVYCKVDAIAHKLDGNLDAPKGHRTQTTEPTDESFLKYLERFQVSIGVNVPSTLSNFTDFQP